MTCPHELYIGHHYFATTFWHHEIDISISIQMTTASCRPLQEEQEQLIDLLEELSSDDVWTAQEAARMLVQWISRHSSGAGGGAWAAVPAAVVAHGAMPALVSLAWRMQDKEHAQQLLEFCIVAWDAVCTAHVGDTLAIIWSACELQLATRF